MDHSHSPHRDRPTCYPLRTPTLPPPAYPIPSEFPFPPPRQPFPCPSHTFVTLGSYTQTPLHHTYMPGRPDISCLPPHRRGPGTPSAHSCQVPEHVATGRVNSITPPLYACRDNVSSLGLDFQLHHACAEPAPFPFAFSTKSPNTSSCPTFPPCGSPSRLWQLPAPLPFPTPYRCHTFTIFFLPQCRTHALVHYGCIYTALQTATPVSQPQKHPDAFGRDLPHRACCHACSLPALHSFCALPFITSRTFCLHYTFHLPSAAQFNQQRD